MYELEVTPAEAEPLAILVTARALRESATLAV